MSIQCLNCQTENLDDAKDCISCGAYLQTSHFNSLYLSPGTTLAEGKYKINKAIGVGGFAITYQGINTFTSEIVAIKERWPERNGSRQDKKVIWGIFRQKNYQEAMENFKLEAELLKKCTHESIVCHYDYFEENNTCYIVMPFIQGKSLEKIVEDTGNLSESQIHNYFLQLAAALKEVHSQGILHRDIKPNNIMIDAKVDRAILIDFGIAREFDENETKIYTIALTHGYAPLEQYASTAKRTASADLYSLCASIYYAFTGEPPAKAGDRLNAIRNKNIDSLQPPSNIGANISPKMEEIILKGMEMEIKNRFQNADELIEYLKGNLTPNELMNVRYLVRQAQGQQDKLESAVKKYEEILASNQDNFSALIELAQVLIHLNRINEAKIYTEIAHQQRPSDGTVNGILGLICCREGEWPDAINYLEQAMKANPQKSWIRLNLVWALGKIGNWHQAKNVLEEAFKLTDVQIESHLAFAQGLQAWISVNQEDYYAAISVARQAIDYSKSPDFKNAQDLQYWVYPCLTVAIDKSLFGSHHLDLLRCLDEFLQQIPAHPFAEGYRGWQLAMQGFILEAIYILEKANASGKAPRWVLLNLAILYEHNGDIQNAVRCYEDYLKIFKDEPFVLLRLSQLMGQKTLENREFEMHPIPILGRLKDNG